MIEILLTFAPLFAFLTGYYLGSSGERRETMEWFKGMASVIASPFQGDPTSGARIKVYKKKDPQSPEQARQEALRKQFKGEE